MELWQRQLSELRGVDGQMEQKYAHLAHYEATNLQASDPRCNTLQACLDAKAIIWP